MKQPEALHLADILQFKLPSIEGLERASAELRRLHELNQVFLKSLVRLSAAALARDTTMGDQCTLFSAQAELRDANKEACEAIAKAGGAA